MFRLYQIWKYKRLYWRWLDKVMTSSGTECTNAFAAATACSIILQRLGHRGLESEPWTAKLERLNGQSRE
jgi:hypothetical protein